ncbi:MAG TPA: hypothetical protein VN241_13230 [Microbacterium sp.]|nr:hypothetical protein [Microbacterium sp.]
MTSEQSGSGPADSPSARRLARTPVWARIAVVLGILVVAAAVIVTVVVATRGGDDPDAALRELCAAAAEDHLERRGSDDIEVAASAMQISESGETYRVQGTATFTQDGVAGQATVRCTARDEDGAWRIASVRVSG